MKLFCVHILWFLLFSNFHISSALPIHVSADFLATKDPDAEEREEESTPIYEKFDALLHGSKAKM